MKKSGGRGGSEPEPLQQRSFPAGGSRGIAHQSFQHGEIFEKATASDPGKTAGGVRTVALIALGYLEKPRFLQDLKVPAEIAVGQAAKLLEVGKGQALW